MNQPFIIGVSGGSGSGKTLFCSHLKERFPSTSIDIFALDNYYLPIEKQPKDASGEANFDTPHSFDLVQLKKDLTRIRSGESIEVPKYEYNIERGAEKPMVKVQAAPIILFEGIFSCYFDELSELIDLKVYVDAPLWLMLKRRIERDEVERGYGNLEETLERYQNHVAPAFERYIEPLRYKADMVIPNINHFDRGLNVIEAFLKHQVGEN